MKKTIALIYGGGSTEHTISGKSAEFIKQSIKLEKNNLLFLEMSKDGVLHSENEQYHFSSSSSLLSSKGEQINVDYAIPCLHGYPGETGDIQSLFEINNFKYLGCNSESSRMCFNKALTKLWLEQFDIPTVPFRSLSKLADLERAQDFINTENEFFVKAVNQGSSIGCYKVRDKSQIKEYVEKALELSSFVIIEKSLEARELEVAVFEFQNKLHVTLPSEIICEEDFYDYDQKYSSKSQVRTITVADIKPELAEQIQALSKTIFESLKLKDLARIDFFLEGDQVYLNEVNTFPGLTSISMFPKMMENYGISFKDFVQEKIDVH